MENRFFEKYSSKIKTLYIPLKDFIFFHSASSHEKVDPKFIGRKVITKQLKDWLLNDNPKTGVYLVTGFRGMGKSSFVGRVLNEIAIQNSDKPKSEKKTTIVIYLLFLLLFTWVTTTLFYFPDTVKKLYLLFIILYFLVSVLIILLFPHLNSKTIKKLYGEKKVDKRSTNIPIVLNLGHDTLNERDILSLITSSISKEFEEYVSLLRFKNKIHWLKPITICLITIPIAICFLFIFIEVNRLYPMWEIPKLISYTNGVLLNTRNAIFNDLGLKVIVNLISSTMALGIAFGIYQLIYKITTSFQQVNIKKIQKQLQELTIRIASATNEDDGPSAGIASNLFGFSFNQKRIRMYPLADVREIEQQLSWILENISRMDTPPQFIIVFDELDKINPAVTQDIPDDPDVLPEFENAGSGFSGGATTRRRKQSLMKLLANMKFFISTAKAKFIFIAGRELYDAFLADSSDREFAIGSIFNNVIHVDSFLTGKYSSKDALSMTEQFIAKQLLPQKEICTKSFLEKLKKLKIDPDNESDYYSFKTYYQYLIEPTRCKTPEDEKIIHKIIQFLYQFSVYLSHISNGAPKKISIHFEEYVVKGIHENDETASLETLCEDEYHLRFTYRQQRKIGFIYYMAFPFINAIQNNAFNFGDKLLITGCFLTNHLYKYHNSGFSWRNIENIPELLDVNKPPQLREFIEIILNYMKKSHLSSTINSLYHFKFPMKIAEEIYFMSRLSEEVSALFNFTLDDSLSVKKHYSKLLKYYTERQKHTAPHNSGKSLHHIIAGIHQILGDLHLLDEKFNEAIFEYQSAISMLTQYNMDINDPHLQSHILSLVRIMLKLGLAHEKRKTFNSAYITYNELVSMLIGFRYIKEQEIGLHYKQTPLNHLTWTDRKDILYKKDNSYYDEKLFRKVQPQLTDLNGNELPTLHLEINSEELIPYLNRQLTPEKNTMLSRLAMFEDVRLIYQTLLAKLFVLEKKGLSSITKENIDRIEADFIYLQRAVYYKEKYMLAADFFRKLADILYYKNGLIDKESSNFYMSLYFWGYDLADDIHNYCTINGFDKYPILKRLLTEAYFEENKENGELMVALDPDKEIQQFLKSGYCRLGKEIGDKLIFQYDSLAKRTFLLINNETGTKKPDSISLKKIHECSKRRERLLNIQKIDPHSISNKRTPCYACKYYNRTLKIIMRNQLGIEEIENSGSKAVRFIELIDNHAKFKSLKNNDILIIAASLEGLGNTLLSCSDSQDSIEKEFLNNFLKLTSVNEQERKVFENYKEIFSQVEKALLYFWGAASYYKYASYMKEAYICYKKIIQLLVAYLEVQLQYDKKENIKLIAKRLETIRKNIFHRALQNIYSQYENTNMVEIQRLKWMYSKQMYEVIELNKLAMYPDIEEMLMVYCQLELHCRKYIEELPELKRFNLGKVYQGIALSPFRLDSTINERVVSLKLKADINMEMLDCLLGFKEVSYKDYFHETVYQQYQDYLEVASQNHPIKSFLKEFPDFIHKNDLNEQDSPLNKMRFIEFLIIDTIFCLSKIIEVISTATHTTLFTDSYIGCVHKELFEINQLYDAIYMMYKYLVNDKEEQDKIKNRINSFILDRRKSETNSPTVPKEEKYIVYLNNLKTTLKEILHKDGKYNCEEYADNFFKLTLDHIGKADVHINITNYHGEMALRKFKNAIEMHREGAAYQNMISNMYLLEDDLNNDTSQFYFAIERYYNNCGLISQNIEILKKVCRNSSLHVAENYLYEKRFN